MSGIVEHVARAVYERGPSYMEGVCIPWDMQRDGKREVCRDDARSAIRATLEYARDNVSQGMIYAGQEIPDEIFVDEAENVFRAMIDALLAELDRETRG